MMHLIKEIVDVRPYELFLKFNTGEIRRVNLEPSIHKWSQSSGSKFKELLEPEVFNSVRLNPEMESIYWDNGIDFCPDMLYSLSET